MTVLILVGALLLAGAAGCGRGDDADPTPTPTPRPTPFPSLPEDEEPDPVDLVPYNGRVEHIFFNEVIAWPEVAWSSTRAQEFDSDYVSADEFTKILRDLYRNDYVLVNLNDTYTEYMTETGHYRMLQETLYIPEGKKPLVISFDNLNITENTSAFGFMSRYVIGTDGEIWAQGTDPDGNSVTAQNLAAITLLDKFVRENPGFSPSGVKGCINLRGATGILGYRTQKKLEDETDEERLVRRQEVALVTPVINQLLDTGWYFGSNTYGGINLNTRSLEDVKADAERWLDEVGSLVGHTKILAYPSGTRLDGGDQGSPGPALQYYVSIGFRFYGAFGSRHHVKNRSEDSTLTAVVYDRAGIGGVSLRYHRSILDRFFDAKDIFDSRRPDLGNTWDD